MVSILSALTDMVILRPAFLIRDVSTFSKDRLCWPPFKTCWVKSSGALMCAIFHEYVILSLIQQIMIVTNVWLFVGSVHGILQETAAFQTCLLELEDSLLNISGMLLVESPLNLNATVERKQVYHL